jgi:hypothetical protein
MGLRRENHDRAGRLEVDDIGKLGIHAEPRDPVATKEGAVAWLALTALAHEDAGSCTLLIVPMFASNP